MEDLISGAVIVFLIMNLVATIHMTLSFWGRLAMWSIRKLVLLVASAEATSEEK